MTVTAGQTLVTRTGCAFDVRPASPADEAALAEFFTYVTAEDLRFRFLTGLKNVGHDRIVAMTNVDHLQTENFLAFVGDKPDIVASAMLACDPEMTRGEVAIVIRPDFKERGISWELLRHVARHAEAIGVKTLESVESRDSHAALELERDMGFTAKAYPGDATLMLVQRTLG